MEVCRMRKTPVIIFVNKMDREGKDPFDLLDELEEELMIQVRPLSWPIEQGARFKGVYNIYEQKLDLYQPSKQMVTEKVAVDIHSEELDQQIVKSLADKLFGRRLCACILWISAEQLRCARVAELFRRDSSQPSSCTGRRA